MWAMLNLNSFMNNGIKNISDTAGRFYFGNRRGQAFMLRAVSALHKSAKMRARHEQNGTHIPPFLIASFPGCQKAALFTLIAQIVPPKRIPVH